MITPVLEVVLVSSFILLTKEETTWLRFCRRIVRVGYCVDNKRDYRGCLGSEGVVALDEIFPKVGGDFWFYIWTPVCVMYLGFYLHITEFTGWESYKVVEEVSRSNW